MEWQQSALKVWLHVALAATINGMEAYGFAAKHEHLVMFA
jgi:hypothetical protein